MSEQRFEIRGRDEIDSIVADLPAAERADTRAIAARLADRPVPRPGLRAAIRQRIAADAAEPRPERLGRAVTAYLSSGAVLLAVAAAGVAGIGPLAS